MPLIYYSMFPDENGPRIGPTGNTLGARLGPPEEGGDIPVAADGTVAPGTGGMSVTPSLETLPLHRIPKWLRSRIPRARGNNALLVWKMGEGAFEPGPVTADLIFRPDPA